jgi:AcrR family transcriptional regulator
MPYRHTARVVRRLAARKDAIVSAALSIANENGMAAVQIAPIARRADVAAGTVYRYFPGKTELLAARRSPRRARCPRSPLPSSPLRPARCSTGALLMR